MTLLETTLPADPVGGRPLPSGTRVHQYEIIKVLGQGGMGTVYLARDLRLGRRVAIKFLRTDEVRQTQRLLAEARATAQCQHENIVVIHEVGEHEGAPYLVLEYLEGRPLTALLGGGRALPYTRATEIACAVARALACAHDAGIVHRDLKPDNVFMTDAGTVKLLDFGIAVADDRPADREPEGQVAGTLSYMAPEQWGVGGEIDRRADLWACGILLHQMICGRHPLPVDRLITIPALEVPMPSLAQAAPPGVPRALVEVVDRCLRKPRDERWPSAAALAAALSPLLPGHGPLALDADESPYSGLASFQERDASKFFGRAREIAELVARIRDRPLIAVAGSSGIGKSSLVRAGVIPALKASGEPWEALVTRPGRRPLEALAALIQPLVAPSIGPASGAKAQHELAWRLRREPGHLGDVLRLRARREQRRLLLFVDQLEELYTQGAEPTERAAFTACLAALADDAASPLRVVLSIRADFLGHVADDGRFAGELARGLWFLGQPSREGLREAIQSPAELAGYRFERPETIDEMIEYLETTPGALPLLQFAAAALWDRRDRARRMLAHTSYAAMGGVAGALASHADRVVSGLPPGSAALVQAILLRLVTAERTRAIAPLAELRGLAPEAGEVEALIERLVDARLLVVQTHEGGEGATVEIVHESLIHGWPALRRWLDEHEDDAALVDQIRTAARQWEAKGRDPGLLWRGDALAEYERWRRRGAAALTPLEAAFGAASLADTARRRRRWRAIAAGAMVVLAGLVLALWRANVAANAAKRDAEALLRDSYIEQGRLRVLEGDKLGALAPLAAAYRMGDTDEATRLLVEEAARPTRPRRLVLGGHTDKLWTIAYSPDGRWLATGSSDGTARLWDAASGATRATIHHDDRVIAVAFSPDSRLLATGGADPTVHVWDVPAGRELAALPSPSGVRLLAFSPDGALLLVAAAQRVVKLWRMPDAAPAGDLDGHEAIVGATFCRDGTFIVTWDIDKLVVWDVATRARRASYEAPAHDQIVTAAISRTGDLVAIGTRSGKLVLLHHDGAQIASRDASSEQISDLVIAPDGATIATASNDLTVRLWSATGEPRGVLAGHRARITRVRFTAAGDRIVTTSADNTARLWTASGALVGELAGHTNLIVMADLRSDGAALATASWDHTAMVWDLRSAEQLHPIVTAPAGERLVTAFAPAGQRLAAAGGGELVVADVATGAIACRGAPGAAITQLTWIGDEQIAVLREEARELELWSARRCAPEGTLVHPALIEELSARGAPRMATVAGRTVHVWRAGQREASFTGFVGRLDGAELDGADVLTVTSAPAAVVVDTIGAPGARRVFRGPSKAIIDVRIDREHGQLLAASLDQSLYVWDLGPGALHRKLEGTGPLWAVRISPDGALLIGVGGISPVMWDRRTGARMGQLEGHSDLVQSGDFLGDRMFITVAVNHTALVWDVAAARPLLRLLDVDAVKVSADHRAVALIGAGGVRLWSPRMPVPDLGALPALLK